MRRSNIVNKNIILLRSTLLERRFFNFETFYYCIITLRKLIARNLRKSKLEQRIKRKKKIINLFDLSRFRSLRSLSFIVIILSSIVQADSFVAITAAVIIQG